MRRIAVALSAIVLTIVACSTVPYTERTRVILISEDQESELGVQAYAEVTGKATLSTDTQQNSMVLAAGHRIAKVADEDLKEGGRDPFQWEFKVIQSNEVNAFCLPGGKIAFYTAILPLCRDETGVAVVMGHEVAHALARHGGERVSQGMVLQLGAGIVDIALAGKSSETREAMQALYGVTTGVAFALPFSRKHELEADHIGLMLMAKAGYDPREAPKFWERMAASGGGQPPQWLSTHPSHEKRTEELQDLVPDAMVFYEKATGVPQQYQRRVLKAD
jgi:predicted Zn-dependent protease